MKTKLRFLKMIWRVMSNKEAGWIFFRMSDDAQKKFINNEGSIDINVRYLGVDKKVVEKIVERLETPKN